MKRLLCLVAMLGGAVSALTPTVQAAGPDVQYTTVFDVLSHGAVGNINAYSLGTSTCNVGDQNLQWHDLGTPGVGFNAYRLHNGRLMQIGLSFVKTACCAFASPGCGMSCNGQGGNVLGTGCQDIYSASWNSIQGALAPRSAINAYSGAFSSFAGSGGNNIFRRLQIAQADMNAATFPGALYFVEGEYVGTDDAASGNRNNNASHAPVLIDGTFTMSLNGNTVTGIPAIRAWRDHGNGMNNPDTTVSVGTLDVPDEGRFHYACKVKDNLNGTWRYEYAVFNLSSDRSGGSFSVPIPKGTQITNPGFHSPDYHSGEIYSNADWTIILGSTSVTWRTPQPIAVNPNSSALRWGTMYNFWFDATRPPADGTVTLGLFKPHTPQSVTFTAQLPAPDCPADINGSDAVDVDDLLAVISGWGPCRVPPATCPANITNAGTSAGAVDVDDLLLVINEWGPCR